MEFWGVEVKSGQPLDVKLGEDKVLHLSQACLGEFKKDAKDSVCLHITVEEKKLVLGTLHSERLPQQLFDLVFDKDFQLSHNWKNGSVFFYGYKADQPSDEHDITDSDFDSDEEDEELQLPVANGKPEAKKEEKAVVPSKKEKSAAGKQKVKIVEPEKDAKADSDDDDSDDSDAMSEDSEDDEDNEDSSDDDEDESDEEEDTPKKVSGKKRPNESTSKTPISDKKAKVSGTPQKTEGKKGGAVHIATPHPSKQAVAKTPAGGSKSNQKSPVSDGAHSCKSCNRNFKSENALSSHNQAKHK